MANTPDGGPAFPQSISNSEGGPTASYDFADGSGMSLRDWFAGQALKSALAEFYKTGGPGMVWQDHGDIAEHVYRIADAMLAAREK